MNKVNYQTLVLMMMDAPRYVKKRADDPTLQSADSEEDQIFKYYQSQI